MQDMYDLLGVGCGPFNLSLAAVLDGVSPDMSEGEVKTLFFERASEFDWHKELMFDDSKMQTSYLKDLVSPVDPTNPHSFMNYLVKHGLFYHFMNTARQTISRYEFEDYCRWVISNLEKTFQFGTGVESIDFLGDHFVVQTTQGEFQAKNICVGSGPVRNIPEVARPFLGKRVFHAKSPETSQMDLTNKRLLIVGGGQTGIEVFRNSLKGKWGKAAKVDLITHRQTLQPLDEAPFTNEFFAPGFIREFLPISQETKDDLVKQQFLSSDGNTPAYLQSLYEDLYLDKYYTRRFPEYTLRPLRWMDQIEEVDDSFRIRMENRLYQSQEFIDADVIVLATGFKTVLPPYLKNLYSRLEFDAWERPVLNPDYSLKADFGEDNKIYAMNFGRHSHGIADPQTSLMAWRSGVIANSLLKRQHYLAEPMQNNFCQYKPIDR